MFISIGYVQWGSFSKSFCADFLSDIQNFKDCPHHFEHDFLMHNRDVMMSGKEICSHFLEQTISIVHFI